MQDFERQSHAIARAAFAEWFWSGFDEGCRRLTAGIDAPSSVPDRFAVEVDQLHLDDGKYGQYLPAFKEAGRQAAIAAQRLGRPELNDRHANEASTSSWERHVFQWWVIINPDPK